MCIRQKELKIACLFFFKNFLSTAAQKNHSFFLPFLIFFTNIMAKSCIIVAFYGCEFGGCIYKSSIVRFSDLSKALDYFRKAMLSLEEEAQSHDEDLVTDYKTGKTDMIVTTYNDKGCEYERDAGAAKHPSGVALYIPLRVAAAAELTMEKLKETLPPITLQQGDEDDEDEDEEEEEEEEDESDGDEDE